MKHEWSIHSSEKFKNSIFICFLEQAFSILSHLLSYAPSRFRSMQTTARSADESWENFSLAYHIFLGIVNNMACYKFLLPHTNMYYREWTISVRKWSVCGNVYSDVLAHLFTTIIYYTYKCIWGSWVQLITK